MPPARARQKQIRAVARVMALMTLVLTLAVSAIRLHAPVSHFKVARDGSEMVYVPGGPFTMGSDKGEADEQPVHTVDVAPYYIGRCLVTNAQFATFLNAVKYRVDRSDPWIDIDATMGQDIVQDGNGRFVVERGRADYPVAGVSWSAAMAYAHWAGARLPTEAEWEKAARGTDARTYPWGDTYDGSRCTVLGKFSADEGAPRYRLHWIRTRVEPDEPVEHAMVKGTTPVQRYPDGVSPYGCFDMAGNVWEWCSSLLAPYPYRADDGREDPTKVGPRVIRGGAWYMTANFARCSNRYRILPYYMHFFDERESLNVGIRLAMSATSASTPPLATATATLRRLSHPPLISLVHQTNHLPTVAEDDAHRLKADGSCKPGEILGYSPTLEQALRYPEADERLDVMERGGRGTTLPHDVLTQIGLRKGMVIGDIGAGAGEFTATMAAMVGPTGEVWATDIAVSALRWMQQRMKNPARWEGPTSNVYLVLTDVTDCLLPDNHFDVIFMSEVHYFYFPRATADSSPPLDQVLRFYRSIARALKSDGRLVLFEINHVPPQNDPQRGTLSTDEIAAEMKQAGFRRIDHKVEVVKVGGYQHWTFNLMIFRRDGAVTVSGATPKQ